MGKRTEAWWVCRVCDTKIKKINSHNKNGNLRQKWLKHRKTCESSTLWMKQVKQ